MTTHTNAIGILPFDHKFKKPLDEKAGKFDEGLKGFSPISRTNRLRKTFLNTEFEINSERALLVTEAYKANESQPIEIKRALALKHILENVTIHTYKDELIVGNSTAPNSHANIYPEFSFDWVIDEMENCPFEEREVEVYLVPDQVKEDLRSIKDYWKGKSVNELYEAQLEYDQLKGSNMGIGAYFLTLYQYGGIGHHVADFPVLLEKGYVGIKNDVVEQLEKLNETKNLAKPDSIQKRNTLKSMIIALDAMMTYVRRYAEAYDELAANEKDAKVKAEYEAIAANCHQIATGTPQNIWQAMQLVHFTVMIFMSESSGHSVSLGRLDSYLYPFYERDIKQGTFTKEFIQEMLESAWIKYGTPTKLRDRYTIMTNAGRGFGGESITIGGVDRDGNDMTNDLTFMMLDATAHTRMMVPWLCVRLHENSPHELKVKTAEVILSGCGHPKVFNDQIAIPMQTEHKDPRARRSLEDARDYAVVGCVELSTPGKEWGWHDAAYYNFTRVFELAINDGKCFDPNCQCCGIDENGNEYRVGIRTGSLKDFKTIEEVKEAFRKQLEHFTENMIIAINVGDVTHARLAPTPFCSAFWQNCIKTGKDLSAGGAEYNHSGPQGMGIATVADSLANIDQLVFGGGDWEGARYSGEDFLKAMESNWEGHEKLYALVNSHKVRHFGNDDDYADSFFADVFNAYCDIVEQHDNPRGGPFKPGVYGVSANVGFGMITGPSLDGRKAGEPVSDNMGPVHTAANNHDYMGPTAVAKSVTKVDHGRAVNGTLLNWKFNPTHVAGEAGRNNLISLIDTYFDRKGMHSQFNIMSTETMRDAMNNPENYKGMLVRVAGYSAYFIDLNKPLQLDLIGRTELSFE